MPHAPSPDSLLHSLQELTPSFNLETQSTMQRPYASAKNSRPTSPATITSPEDLLIYEDHEILYNRTSTLHTDSSDPQNGWAILTAFGTFKGGYVRLPNLGLRIRLEPGDAIALRGRVIPHEVEAWDGGQRISIPHFTHSSVWRSMGFTSVFTF